MTSPLPPFFVLLHFGLVSLVAALIAFLVWSIFDEVRLGTVDRDEVSPRSQAKARTVKVAQVVCLVVSWLSLVVAFGLAIAAMASLVTYL